MMPPFETFKVETFDEITALGAPAIQEIIDRWELELEIHSRKAKNKFSTPEHIEDVIRKLKKIQQNAPNIPPFVRFRPVGWFKENDDVIVFFGNYIDRDIPFLKGKIIFHSNGMWIRVLFKRKIHNNMQLERGCAIENAWPRPEILHPWEFDYLHEHNNYTIKWVMRGLTDTIEWPQKELFIKSIALYDTAPE